MFVKVKSVEGMAEEQGRVVTAFALTILFVQLNNIGIYWIMMTHHNAIVATVITGVGLMYQYHCTLRIYNRFAFPISHAAGWTEDERGVRVSSDSEPSHGIQNLSKDAALGVQTMSASGYLTVLVKAKRYERQFVVMRGPRVYFYRSKDSYLLHPTDSLNKRPVCFPNYKMEIDISDDNLCIFLTPTLDAKSKTWEFRCDTMEELNEWTARFNESIKS